jgi:hypothetical protein
MDFQFELPRTARPKLLFLAAVILSMVLWPVLQRVMGLVSPDLSSDSQGESRGWDLRAM